MDCYINYDTFILNFKKNIFYIKENIDKDVFVKIVKEYLSCKNNYSDEVFLENIVIWLFFLDFFLLWILIIEYGK